MSTTGEFTVTDELYEISEATNSDGSVDVEIFDFEKTSNGEKVKVWFHTPTMDKRSEKMKWPRNDSNEYKFVRLCRKTVGGLNGAEWLKQDGASISADPDDWTINARLNRRERVKSFISKRTIDEFILMIVGIIIAVWMLTLSIIAVGLPILWFLSYFGGPTLFAGAALAWAVSIIAWTISMIVVVAIKEE